MDEPTPTYAWCFSHGRLHTFWPGRVWCTATWIELDGSTEDAALTDKQDRFGDAQFDHQLPAEQRLAVVEAHADRHRQG